MSSLDAVDPERGLRARRSVIALILGLCVAAVLVVPLLGGRGGGDPAMTDAVSGAVASVDIVIPAGAGERLDRGEQVDVLPETLEVRVGDTIEIVNDDVRGHVAGPFYMGAGETLRQTFTRPGRLVGECSVHPSGRFELDVRP